MSSATPASAPQANLRQGNKNRTLWANFARWLKRALVPLMLASLAACAENFDASVSRFATQLPAPQGQSFAIVADAPELAGGLEFDQYSRLVAAQMTKLGYAQAASPDTATLIVRFDYGVDQGRERLSPFANDPFWGPWHGYTGYGRFAGAYGYPGGYWGPGAYGYRPWGFGWYDPWFAQQAETYTIYTSGIALKINSRADGRRLFEGKAEAVSTSNRLPYLVPNLVEAMFTGFPGNSGETVRISVAPEKKVGK